MPNANKTSGKSDEKAPPGCVDASAAVIGADGLALPLEPVGKIRWPTGTSAARLFAGENLLAPFANHNP